MPLGSTGLVCWGGKVLFMPRQLSLIEADTDALLQTIAKGQQPDLTFSAVHDGGSLTTWREPGMAQFGPDLRYRTADPIGATYWVELHRLGECIQATGGLDALDEANMRIVQMDLSRSDWRAMVLESVWYDIGRAT